MYSLWIIQIIDTFEQKIQPNFCLASMKACSHCVRLSALENMMDILCMPVLLNEKMGKIQTD